MIRSNFNSRLRNPRLDPDAETPMCDCLSLAVALVHGRNRRPGSEVGYRGGIHLGRVEMTENEHVHEEEPTWDSWTEDERKQAIERELTVIMALSDSLRDSSPGKPYRTLVNPTTTALLRFAKPVTERIIQEACCKTHAMQEITVFILFHAFISGYRLGWHGFENSDIETKWEDFEAPTPEMIQERYELLLREREEEEKKTDEDRVQEVLAEFGIDVSQAVDNGQGAFVLAGDAAEKLIEALGEHRHGHHGPPVVPRASEGDSGHPGQYI